MFGSWIFTSLVQENVWQLGIHLTLGRVEEIIAPLLLEKFRPPCLSPLPMPENQSLQEASFFLFFFLFPFFSSTFLFLFIFQKEEEGLF